MTTDNDTNDALPDAPPIPFEQSGAPTPSDDTAPKQLRKRRGVQGGTARQQQPAPPDLSALGKPAAKRTRSTRSKPAAKVDLTPQLVELTAGLAVIAGMRDPLDGVIVMMNAEKLANTFGKLAGENEAVYRVLDALVNGSTMALAASALLAVAVPIAVNHGVKLPLVKNGDAVLKPYRDKLEELQAAA